MTDSFFGIHYFRAKPKSPLLLHNRSGKVNSILIFLLKHPLLVNIDTMCVLYIFKGFIPIAHVMLFQDVGLCFVPILQFKSKVIWLRSGELDWYQASLNDRWIKPHREAMHKLHLNRVGYRYFSDPSACRWILFPTFICWENRSYLAQSNSKCSEACGDIPVDNCEF